MVAKQFQYSVPSPKSNSVLLLVEKVIAFQNMLVVSGDRFKISCLTIVPGGIQQSTPWSNTLYEEFPECIVFLKC